MRKAVGVALVVVGVALGSVCIVALQVQPNSPLTRWLTAFSALLVYFNIGFDITVLSLCAGAALLSGVLLLTKVIPVAVEQGTPEGALLTGNSSKAVAVGWQTVRFFLHLAAIYAIAASCTPQLAGWTKHSLLPFLQLSTSSSSFQFLFSHMLVFSFIPGFLVGLLNARFKHKVALYVWLVPTVVLAYKFVTFPMPTQSVLGSASWFSLHQHQFASAFHEYFAGGFLIQEYRDYREMWWMVQSNPDMARGMSQLRLTAPFYAAVAYCLAAWIALRTQLHRKVRERTKEWERWKFGRPA